MYSNEMYAIHNEMLLSYMYVIQYTMKSLISIQVNFNFVCNFKLQVNFVW